MKDIEIKYRDYASSFWTQITNALWSEQQSFEYLPIVFGYDTDKGANKSTNGVTHFHTNTRTGISSIYPVVYLRGERTEDEIQQTIRHEAIHYFLGLQYRCHDDNSALFWIVCDLFDGGAYMPLSGKSDDIFEIAIPFFKAAFQLYQESPQSTVPINLALMLTAVDEAESSENPDLEHLEKGLTACLDAAKLSVKAKNKLK